MFGEELHGRRALGRKIPYEPALLNSLRSQAEVHAAVQAIVRTSSSYNSVQEIVQALAHPNAQVRRNALEQQRILHERLGAPYARIASEFGLAKACVQGISLALRETHEAEC